MTTLPLTTTTAIKAIYNSIYNTEVLTKSVLFYWSVFMPNQHTATMDAIKRRYRVRLPATSRTGYHDLEFCPCIKIFAGCHFTCIFMSFRMPFPFHAFPAPLDSLDTCNSPNFSCSEVVDLSRLDLFMSVRSPTCSDFAVTWLNSLRDARCSREHHDACFICSELECPEMPEFIPM